MKREKRDRMIFDTAVDDYDGDVDWVIVSEISLARGVVRHWKGYVAGICKFSRVIWGDDDPTDPPAMDMAA